jgi:hypothetical protein
MSSHCFKIKYIHTYIFQLSFVCANSLINYSILFKGRVMAITLLQFIYYLFLMKKHTQAR